ncbi:SIR2 family protein [Ferruginibacter sp.]
MKKMVLFLGAGMSASFGYPLTSSILPSIIKRIKDGSLFDHNGASDKVANMYRQLLKNLVIALSPGMRAHFDEKAVEKPAIPLVTELLSQLEYMISSGHSLMDWNFDLDEIKLQPEKLTDRWSLESLKTLFDWAIISIINDHEPLPSKSIEKYLEWIKRSNKERKHFVSIVSSNYDVSFESSLLTKEQVWDADKFVDYGVSWRDPVLNEAVVYDRPKDPLYRIFKLHGSTDWLKCRRCGFLYINPTNDIYDLTFSNNKIPDNTCHCGYWPLQPVLVTMSFNRKMDEPNLHEIWRNCFEELRSADEWIIVGYSLPAEDFDIRSMFLRALAAKDKWPKITVVQLSESSKPRYDSFLGIKQYNFKCGGFDKYADEFLAELSK